MIRPIAAGGMAELYLTRTVGIEGFEKLVCVKRILPQYSGNPKFVNMFLKEARLAATLHHPNIAQVYDIGQDKGEYFFSMEYVHGEDLGRIVSAGRENGVPISLDCSLTLVAGLCAGLHYAHDKAAPDGKPLGVVHRDVSPTNVLVSYDGAVKLVDFGIARAGESSATSQTGGLKGKISYMSPEQCRGKVTLDRRSDVFSVGTILYELTTGRLPFVADTEYGVLHQVVNRDADPPSTLVPNYPPALEAIVMRALARDPGRRFSTALELQHQLEDFAHDNRLRVSPLVLARLMSTLFPARLEEWDHARAQGAFFVEQHVVRTLIEDGKTADGAPRYQTPGIDREDGGSKAVASTSPEADSSERTEIGPEPQMPPLLNVRPATPPPVPNARPSAPLPSVRPATPVPSMRPSSAPLPSVRPATPVPSMRPAMPVPSMRPATPVPSSPATVPPAPGAHASGVQSPASRPPAVPNPPGAVPIVGGMSGPPIPSGGTLVSSATQAGKPPSTAVPTPSPYGPPGGLGG
ncbi:MAG TPA: protein kinase, partial [Kofleriaceae bacterium]|nr:protein kinase [Kofleriaceae bacterium]